MYDLEAVHIVAIAIIVIITSEYIELNGRSTCVKRQRTSVDISLIVIIKDILIYNVK